MSKLTKYNCQCDAKIHIIFKQLLNIYIYFHSAANHTKKCTFVAEFFYTNVMREFIIADNQDITKVGMMFLLGRQKDTSLLLEADDKAELIQQLCLHSTAIVILDYTLFDFSGFEELMVLHERFK